MNPKRHVGRQTGPAHTRALPHPAGGVALTTYVPWTLIKRGVPAQVIAPPGATTTPFAAHRSAPRPTASRADSPLLRSLGLAHHWQRLLDEGRAASVADIAQAEGVDESYVRRLLRLTLLAPEVIEHLVVTPGMTLEQVMRRSWPNGWDEQKQVIALAARD